MRYVQSYKHRGRWRLRFRRHGYSGRDLPIPLGYRGDKSSLANSPEFLTAYLAAMAEPVVALKPGEKRAAYGTVAWLVGEYLSSLDFLGRPKSMQEKHRRHCEAFRVRRGDLPVAGIEPVHLEKLLAKMIDTPAAANQWLDAMKDLMRYAIKRKLIAVNPAADIKRRPSGNPDGHHTWTPEQVEQFRHAHPVGTKARLALELLWWLGMRRSDVIRLGPPDVCGGVLGYVQFKMREREPSRVEVEIPADLAATIRATPGTGIRTWLVDGHGKPFTESAFGHWFGEACDQAGLPRRQKPNGEWVRLCTAHGLRKRFLTDLADGGATDHQLLAAGGHRSLKEVERYTRKTDRARNAKAAMQKIEQYRKATAEAGKVSHHGPGVTV